MYIPSVKSRLSDIENCGVFKQGNYDTKFNMKKTKVLTPVKDTTMYPRTCKLRIFHRKNRSRKLCDKDNMMLEKNYDDVLKLFRRLTPELHSTRVTRSVSKVINYYNNFIILEDYRCMPLLGDEEEVPNWEVHIVKYSIVFV